MSDKFHVLGIPDNRSPANSHRGKPEPIVLLLNSEGDSIEIDPRDAKDVADSIIVAAAEACVHEREWESKVFGDNK